VPQARPVWADKSGVNSISRGLARGPDLMRTVVIGVLMIIGGALAGVTVLLPPAGTGSDAVVLVVGAMSALTGLALVLPRKPRPEWLLGLVTLGGTVLITVATYEGGAGRTGTADNEMLYIWICLFSFYFLDFRHALAQLSAVGVAYAVLLHNQGVGLDDAATRMVVTMATLLVSGLLVYRLRRWLDGSLSDLTDRARLDSLSGLLNRRALEERAVVEFARQRREESKVGMLMVDIDGFKALNDSAGHHAGDEVLCKVARVLEAGTREVDIVARVGGDEFAILLPGADAKASGTIARRLCDAVHEELAEQGVGLAVSIGVAVGPDAGHTLEDLWQAADGAMYVAKRDGGNAVSSMTAAAT
jgi:diguanylate cyclase (GGDEF)-like protein